MELDDLNYTRSPGDIRIGRNITLPIKRGFFTVNISSVPDNWTYGSIDLFATVNRTAAVTHAIDIIPLNMDVTVLFHKGRAISIEVPMFVVMEITECEPGVKGDTRSSSMKPAVLSTGAKVNVPLFVEQGEWIKVDTRTSEYVERAKR